MIKVSYMEYFSLDMSKWFCTEGEALVTGVLICRWMQERLGIIDIEE